MAQWQPSVTVIAIAGPSGGGKTTLVDQVAALLGNTTRLYFDDYAAVSSYPQDVPGWIAAGADPNDWRTPRLAEDLQTLRQGTAILHPDGTTVQEPSRYIVLEEPFGRERHEMAPLIDFVACLDTPLDVAVVRRLRRDVRQRSSHTPTVEELVTGLEEYLTFYLEVLRAGYQSVHARALASCDLALDGTQPVEHLADHVVGAVRGHDALRAADRGQAERATEPTVGGIDHQAVQTGVKRS